MRHGLLLIAKPSGPTSHDIVSVVRQRLSEPAVGHLGTLDPAAEGLLILAVGAKALKVVEFFRELPKEYEAKVLLGSVSTTYDREGVIEEVKAKPGWQIPPVEEVRRILLDRFVGTIDQVPPVHSAVHVSGERAYARARRGQTVTMAARQVQIEHCELLSYDYPEIRLRVRCGSGTYIRSIAHDLGQCLRCGGYLAGLRRTKVGEWAVEDAVDPDEATWTDIVPLKDVMRSFPGIELTDEEAEHVRTGRNIRREVTPDTFGWHNGLPLTVLVPAKDGTRMAHPRKVL